jgi:XTP/dITP diphosphohydrolase
MLNQSPVNLLIATSNKSKLREVKSYLNPLEISLKDLNDFPMLVQPVEDGKTFPDNAIIKAQFYSSRTKLWALADDSGLEVDALGGRPGVLSARYAGDRATDEERIALLLCELKFIPETERTARFVCALAFCSPNEKLVKLTIGKCEGRIAFEPRGTNGFGYDPIFIPQGFDKTFGELPSDVKQNFSHRGKALYEFAQFFSDFLAIRT